MLQQTAQHGGSRQLMLWGGTRNFGNEGKAELCGRWNETAGFALVGRGWNWVYAGVFTECRGDG